MDELLELANLVNGVETAAGKAMMHQSLYMGLKAIRIKAGPQSLLIKPNTKLTIMETKGARSSTYKVGTVDIDPPVSVAASEVVKLLMYSKPIITNGKAAKDAVAKVAKSKVDNTQSNPDIQQALKSIMWAKSNFKPTLEWAKAYMAVYSKINITVATTAKYIIVMANKFKGVKSTGTVPKGRDSGTVEKVVASINRLALERSNEAWKLLSDADTYWFIKAMEAYKDVAVYTLLADAIAKNDRAAVRRISGDLTTRFNKGVPKYVLDYVNRFER